MAELSWYKSSFSNALTRHAKQKALLLINLTFSPAAASEETLLNDVMLNSLDLDGAKYVALRIELDHPSARRRAFFASFPDYKTPGAVFLGFNDDGTSKMYETINPAEDLTVSIAPILAEYKAYYANFRSSHPDFVSDNEEDPEEVEAPPKDSEEAKQEIKEKLAKIRAQKAEDEKQAALANEIRRRTDGKSMLEVQEKYKDQQQKLDLERRQREKDDDKRRLAELRELERRDREERMRRQQGIADAPPPAKMTAAPVAPVVNSEQCRICYQFPDGVRVQKVFESKACFQEVYDAIKDDDRLAGSNYKLFTTFPRAAVEDYGKNLIDLNLTPASVLAVVKPTSSNEAESKSVVAASTGFIQRTLVYVITLVTATLTSGLHLIYNALGMQNNNDSSNAGGQSRPSQERAQEGRRFKRDGNVGRLGDEDSGDDEGTWNGNSTQQL